MSIAKLIGCIALSKLSLIFNRNCCVSALLLDSSFDRTASIRQKCRIYGSSIGKYSYIGRNSLIQNVKIGSFCSISEECNIGMPSHPMNFISTSPAFLSGRNILNKHFAEIVYDDCPDTVVANDVWIGTGAKIKSGLHIGNGAVIAAGAVVTHDVEPFSIVAGIPAKHIRYRFDDETAERIQKSQWWTLPDNRLTKYAKYIEKPIEFLNLIENEVSNK